MQWYLIYTKPRQEKCALQNLEQQGYSCYLPLLQAEKLLNGNVVIAEKPLFPRYLFVQLDSSSSGKSWVPIRSTKGVSRLVSFGLEPAKVSNYLIEFLKSKERDEYSHAAPLFTQGERVVFAEGAFAGIEGIYQMQDGENRVMVLIELLSKPVALRAPIANIRKLSI
ncbi:transcription/translation regulatory transformer protein RfaH [Herbaspirillum sp. NPDC101397]|uniref:transcription/translation regulatory transformer protein RfaH n=1 Tax=Herbaspirillum sp. NPDC101397 TaxID=3364006 RepID=UPI00383B49C2